MQLASDVAVVTKMVENITEERDDRRRMSCQTDYKWRMYKVPNISKSSQQKTEQELKTLLNFNFYNLANILVIVYMEIFFSQF